MSVTRHAAFTAAVAATASVLLAGAPARAADVFVQVTPTTVQAGFLVGIRASCTDNSASATVESPAFGMVTVQPQQGVLTAAALVPAGTDAGMYRVKLNCPDGKNASTMLNVTAAGHPSRGPATGFGGGAGGDPGALLLTGGAATTVAGVVLGLVALRRRAAGARTVRAGVRR